MNDNTNLKTPDYTFYLFHQDKGHFISIHNGFIIGRSVGDLVFNNDKRLSRSHCKFVIEGEDAEIKDLDTTNGLVVNGENTKEIELNHNDIIQVGGQIFIFSLTNNMSDLKLDGPDDTQISTQLSLTEYAEELEDQDSQIVEFSFKDTLKFAIKAPLNYQKENRIYYLLPAIMALYILVTTESGLFYSFFEVAFDNFLAIGTSYYLTCSLYFFIKLRILDKKITDNDKKEKFKKYLIIVGCPVIMLFMTSLTGDFFGTDKMEETNLVDLRCRKLVNFSVCGNIIYKIYKDKKLLRNKHRIVIVDTYYKELNKYLEKRWQFPGSTILKLAELQESSKKYLIKPDVKMFFKKHTKIKTIISAEIKIYKQLRSTIKCFGKLHLSSKRLQINERLELYCVNKNGVKNGAFVFFDKFNKIFSKGSFKNNKLEGEFELYHPNGQLKELFHYSQGVIDETELFSRWNDKGEVIYRDMFKKRIKSYLKKNVDKIWITCRSKKELVHKCLELKLEERMMLMHPNNANNLLIISSGLFERYINLMEEKLNREKLNTFDIICKSGTKLIIKKLKNGNVQKYCVKKDGKWHGPYAIFYKDGKLKVTGNYISGISSGIFKNYYPNGVISLEGAFYNNKWVGEAIIRNIEGKIIFEGEIPKKLPDFKKMAQKSLLNCKNKLGKTTNVEPAKLFMKKCMFPVVRLYSSKAHPAASQMLKNEIMYELSKFSNKLSIGELKCSDGEFLKKSSTKRMMHYCVSKNNNKRNGPYIIFYKNFVPKEVGFHKNGNRSGPFKRFHENGKLSVISRYMYGLYIGISSRWDINGIFEVEYAVEDVFQKKFVEIYKKIIIKCKNQKRSKCITGSINKYCRANKKIDCARLVEAQNYYEIYIMEDR